MKSFSILQTEGHQNNFDIIRFVSACLVIITHSFVLVGLTVNEDYLMKLSNNAIMLSTLGLKCFFIISGFLISASVCSTPTYKEYIWKRSLRIFPGLIVVVLLAIFVLGPIFTSFSLSDYFQNSLTWSYLKNILLYKIYYKLPGVFETNPSQTVNGSIWTLVYEFLMYIGVVALHYLGAYKKRVVIVGLFIFLLVFRIFMEYYTLPDKIIWYLPHTDLHLFHTIDFGLYFAAGMLIYTFREEIRFNNILFLFILIGWIISFYVKAYFVLHYFCVPYLLFFIAYHPQLRLFNRFAKYGDFSYGMYLYGMPIQQIIVFFLKNSISAEVLMVLSLVLTFPFAVLSWYLVESKALRLKNIFQRKPLQNKTPIKI